MISAIQLQERIICGKACIYDECYKKMCECRVCKRKSMGLSVNLPLESIQCDSANQIF